MWPDKQLPKRVPNHGNNSRKAQRTIDSRIVMKEFLNKTIWGRRTPEPSSTTKLRLIPLVSQRGRCFRTAPDLFKSKEKESIRTILLTDGTQTHSYRQWKQCKGGVSGPATHNAPAGCGGGKLWVRWVVPLSVSWKRPMQQWLMFISEWPSGPHKGSRHTTNLLGKLFFQHHVSVHRIGFLVRSVL